MRTYSLIITLLFLLSLWLHWDNNQTSSANTKALQSEILSGKKAADSLNRLAEAKEDSLSLAFEMICYAKAETEEANRLRVYHQKEARRAKQRLAQVQPHIDTLAARDTAVMILQIAYLHCDSLASANANELIKQGAELLKTGNALKLAVSLAETNKAESDTLRSTLSKSEQLTKQTAKQERKKGIKIGLIGGVIVTIAAFLAL